MFSGGVGLLYQTTRYHVAEDSISHNYDCENLKFLIIIDRHPEIQGG